MAGSPFHHMHCNRFLDGLMRVAAYGVRQNAHLLTITTHFYGDFR